VVRSFEGLARACRVLRIRREAGAGARDQIMERDVSSGIDGRSNIHRHFLEVARASMRHAITVKVNPNADPLSSSGYLRLIRSLARIR